MKKGITKKEIECGYCKKITKKPLKDVNRATARGNDLYCNNDCYMQNRQKNTKAKGIINKLEVAANNWLAGSNKWLAQGAIMNLGLPSIKYRVKL